MVCFNRRGRGWREAGGDPRSRCEEAARGGEGTRHPLRMKSWNGQIGVKADGEAKKVLGLKKGGRERKDAGPVRRAVPVPVGSGRIWFSQECSVLVTDTKPE